MFCKRWRCAEYSVVVSLEGKLINRSKLHFQFLTLDGGVLGHEVVMPTTNSCAKETPGPDLGFLAPTVLVNRLLEHRRNRKHLSKDQSSMA